MPYGIVHHFADGTKEQYEASLAAVHPGPEELPEGQVLHFAGPGSDGGWTIVAFHVSKESWEQFRDSVLRPALAGGIEGGFTSPPQELTFDVDTHLRGSR
jgi:hypothetical protein